MSPIHHLVYQLRNAKLNNYPFPHFFVENVFPQDFYTELLSTLPTPDEYQGVEGRYNGRKFGDPTQNPLLSFMQTKEFLLQMGAIFKSCIEPGKNLEVFTDLRLVRDGEGYSIGPHTDAPWKLVSLLFYLPKYDDLKTLGTSIYTPKDPTFTCNGGPHHKFEYFDKVFTAPFIPNSCFGFWKTNRSFHGVEPITIPCTRNILLYNVYDKTLYEQHHQPKG